MRVAYCIGIGLLALLAGLGAGAGCLPDQYPKPVLIGVWQPERGGIGDFAVQGQTAFLLQAERLASIDVSNPTHPQEIGSIDLLGYSHHDIRIVDNYVYTASTTGNRQTSYLQIIDVSIPHSPQRVGTLTVENANFLAVGVKENAAYVYDDTSEDILVIDLSNPVNPAYIGSVPIGFNVFNIYVHGNLAFLANSGLGVVVLDITTPLDPIFLSRFEIEQGGVRDIAAKGQHAYFPKWAGPGEDFSKFMVLDASNPTQPEQIASIEIGKFHSGASDMGLEGTIVAISMGDSTDYVQLVDISDPASPQQKGSADIPPEFSEAGDHFQGSVVIQNGLIYVSASKGLVIYEIVYE